MDLAKGRTMNPSLRHLPLWLTGAALAGGLCLSACQAPGDAHAAPLATIAPPALGAAKGVDLPGVHNVVTYAPSCIGGAVPEGAEGLRTLAAMGVKTIVSVDGATPDVEAAKQFGMRYIHLPISYNGISKERQIELAQVVANADGPIYMHCHHGKHRSASALASALVLAGKITTDEAVAHMKASGTGENYQGLWAAAKEAKPLDRAVLAADVAKFPSVATVSGMVATMSELDTVFENVTALSKAKWLAPKDHPDLVPGKETRRLHSLYSQLHQDPESLQKPADYQKLLEKAIGQSQALDVAVQQGDTAAADAQFVLVQKGCKECHKSFRDN